MKIEKAMFGAGCFWGVEQAFRKVKGIISTTVGFSGGNIVDPTYEEVCQKNTGHAEVVEIEFDSDLVSYKDLLQTFWKIHDPTSYHRQGFDIGDQYRSVIFYYSDEQKKIATTSLEEESKKHTKKIVTEILGVKPFYKAEEYHQRYLEKNKGLFC